MPGDGLFPSTVGYVGGAPIEETPEKDRQARHRNSNQCFLVDDSRSRQLKVARAYQMGGVTDRRLVKGWQRFGS